MSALTLGAVKDDKAITPEVVAAVTTVELVGLQPAVLERLSKPAQATAAAAQTRAVFRCGFWSDGVLELRRDGAQVARLTQEGERLAALMARMLDTSRHRLHAEGDGLKHVAVPVE